MVPAASQPATVLLRYC